MSLTGDEMKQPVTPNKMIWVPSEAKSPTMKTFYQPDVTLFVENTKIGLLIAYCFFFFFYFSEENFFFVQLK